LVAACSNLFSASKTNLEQRLRLNISKRSKIVIFESLLITFEARNLFFEAARAVFKIDSSLKTTTMTKLSLSKSQRRTVVCLHMWLSRYDYNKWIIQFTILTIPICSKNDYRTGNKYDNGISSDLHSDRRESSTEKVNPLRCKRFWWPIQWYVIM